MKIENEREREKRGYCVVCIEKVKDFKYILGGKTITRLVNLTYAEKGML